MDEPMTGVGALEVPERDEESLAIDERAEALPLEMLSGDLEVPVPDAVEQHLPVPGYDDDTWR